MAGSSIWAPVITIADTWLRNFLQSRAGASYVNFTYDSDDSIIQSLQSIVRDGRVSVKGFGAVGNYTTDDTAAIIKADIYAASIGKTLYFPRGVYSMFNGYNRLTHWEGEGAPQLAPFPLTNDDKRFLRPGYKHLLPGSVVMFRGTGTATAVTQRTDDYASFTYSVRTAITGLRMEKMAIVNDTDIYDVDGNLTAYGAENSANYQVGSYFDDCPQNLIVDVVVFGYYPKAGTAIRTVLGLDDPDYTIFRGGSTMGRHGLALIGSQTNDGVSSGMSGTMTFGLDIFTLDHHARSLATAPTIYANADTWACIFIDGMTTAVTANINGHYFHGGSIRTYAIHPIQLRAASQASFSQCIFETSNFSSATFAATKQWLANIDTIDVMISMCRFAGDVGLLLPAFGGAMSGQLIIMGCPGMAMGGGVIVSERNPADGTSAWLKFGGASGGSGDPAIQFGTGNALSSTTGWSFRRDLSNSDVLEFRWAGAITFQLRTDGGIGRFARSVGPTRTIAADAITIGDFSYYRVANEGAAATDNLATINGGVVDGQELILAAASSTQDVIVKKGPPGNIRIPADFTLTHAQDRISLQYDGQNWCGLGAEDNTA